MKIAIDAMGGDLGPPPLVSGAAMAYRSLGVLPVLVGNRPDLEKTIATLGLKDIPFTIADASDTILMSDGATDVRRRKESSIWVATSLLKDGAVEAVISAGHSGASMATALFVLGRIKGIDRPAIATILPHRKGAFVLLDAGANVDCKPHHLLQFARMGHEYARMALNIDKPRVALLSNGEEDGKGNELVRETAELMGTTGFPFAGNIEGRELFEGGADVVVTDGFVGNVVLKTAEGLADSLMTMVREAVLSSPLARVGGLLIRPALSRMKKRIDYAEYGGAPLLGVNGPFFICHGKSSDLAIFNAFRVAKSVASGDLVSRLSKIQESL